MRKKCHQKITMTQIQIKHPNYIHLHTNKQGVYSVEVTALTSMFEKSATRYKSNLLTFKSTVNIVIFNIRT